MSFTFRSCSHAQGARTFPPAWSYHPIITRAPAAFSLFTFSLAPHSSVTFGSPCRHICIQAPRRHIHCDVPPHSISFRDLTIIGLLLSIPDGHINYAKILLSVFFQTNKRAMVRVSVHLPTGCSRPWITHQPRDPE